MTRYVIRRPDEETACDQCGWPLDIGDTAFETDRGAVTCSATCARTHDRARARRKETADHAPE